MKKIKSVFLLLTIIFSAFTFADDGCGVDEFGDVAPFNADICAEDISFRLVYAILGELYDGYVLNSGVTKYLSIESMEIQMEGDSFSYSVMGVIMKDIFSAMTYLTVIVAIVIFIYYSVLSIASSAGGDFLGGINIRASSSRFAVALFLLTPVSGVTVIQIILMHVSLGSIGLANFVYSGYIAIISGQENELNVNYAPGSGDVDKTSAHWQYSMENVRDLTKIAICRSRTSQIVLAAATADDVDIGKFKECNAPAVDSVTVNIESNEFPKRESFIRYHISDNSGNIRVSNSLNFENVVNPGCYSSSTVEYRCGSIDFTGNNFKISDFVVDYEKFEKQIIADARALSGSIYNSDFTTQVNDRWKNIKNNIEDYIRPQYGIRGLGSLNKVEEWSDASAAKAYKIIGYQYHQKLQNYLTYGMVTGKTEVTQKMLGWLAKLFSVPKIDADVDLADIYLADMMRDVEKIAKAIESKHCSEMGYDLTLGKEGFDIFAGGGKPYGKPTRCYFFDNRGQMEYLGLVNGRPYILESGENRSSEYEAYLNSQNDIITQNAEKVAERIYRIRLAVSNSFSIALKDDDQLGNHRKSLLSKARKLGWAGAGSLMQKIFAETDIDQRMQLALFYGSQINLTMGQSLVAIFPTVEERAMIELEKMEAEARRNKFSRGLSRAWEYISAPFRSDTGTSLIVYDFFEAMSHRVSQAFSPLKVDETGTSFAVNISSKFDNYLAEEYDNMSKSTGAMSIAPIAETIKLLSKNVTAFTDAVGTEKKYLTMQEDLMDDCIKGLNNCGLSLIHPMQPITKLGQDLITASTVLGGAGIMAYMANRFEGSNAAGKIKEVKKANEKLLESEKGFSKFKYAAGTIEALIKSLVALLLWMAFVGIIFAYLIPLTPFFIFITAMLAWVIVLIEVLVVSNIWVALILQPKNINQNDEGIQAIRNAVLQLFLRPVLVTIGLIIAWSLFSLMLTLINMLIGPLISSTTSSDSFVIKIVDILFGVTAYLALIYIALTTTFGLVTSIPNKIMMSVGARPVSESGEVMNKLTKMATAMVAYKMMNNALKQQPDKNKGKEEEPDKNRGKGEEPNNPDETNDDNKQPDTPNDSNKGDR